MLSPRCAIGGRVWWVGGEDSVTIELVGTTLSPLVLSSLLVYSSEISFEMTPSGSSKPPVSVFFTGTSAYIITDSGCWSQALVNVIVKC